MRLLNGDCLELMGSIPDGSIDLVLCDLPYGSTACPWDHRIDPARLWAHYRRLVRPGGNVILTCDFRFGVELVNTAPKGWYRDETVWDKVLTTGFLDAKRRPLRRHEFILRFAPKGRSTYRPQMGQGQPYTSKGSPVAKPQIYRGGGGPAKDQVYGKHDRKPASVNTGTRYPTSIVQFRNVKKGPDRFHPTQKPPELVRYLLETYSEPLARVLDNTMGSGSTGVGCLETGRQFIGIERDPTYFAKAVAWLRRLGASIDLGDAGEMRRTG